MHVIVNLIQNGTEMHDLERNNKKYMGCMRRKLWSLQELSKKTCNIQSSYMKRLKTAKLTHISKLISLDFYSNAFIVPMWAFLGKIQQKYSEIYIEY